MNKNSTICITVDYREKASGIPHLLRQMNAEVAIKPLLTGDYVIEERIIIERKSAEDFVQSIISNRLFPQCARMRKMATNPVFLLEGNPYKANHKMSAQAIRGALLSIKTAWQIPIIYSKNKEDSAEILMTLGKQQARKAQLIRLINGYKPKRIRSHKPRFLQGLPTVGSVLAHRLYDHFGSIRSVVNSSEEDLLKIHGIDKIAAREIKTFVS